MLITTRIIGELFRFTVTLTNCDGAATVGASLNLLGELLLDLFLEVDMEYGSG